MNIESLAVGVGTGTGTCTGSYYKKIMQEFSKVSVTCDGRMHTTIKIPGYDVSCEGIGCIECSIGWIQGTGQPGTSTSLCPEEEFWWASCPIREK